IAPARLEDGQTKLDLGFCLHRYSSGVEAGGGVGRKIESSGILSLGRTGSARRISIFGDGVGVTGSARKTGLFSSVSTRSAFSTGFSVGDSTASAFMTGFVGSGNSVGRSASGGFSRSVFSIGSGLTVEWLELYDS